MMTKSISDLAREVGLSPAWVNAAGPSLMLENLVAAAIAQYRESLLAGVGEPAYYWEPDGAIEWLGADNSQFSTNTGPAHGWKVTHYYTADQLTAAVAIERERCAKLCDATALTHEQGDDAATGSYRCAAAIRGQE